MASPLVALALLSLAFLLRLSLELDQHLLACLRVAGPDLVPGEDLYARPADPRDATIGRVIGRGELLGDTVVNNPLASLVLAGARLVAAKAE